MPNVMPKYPLDLSGRNPMNLVAGEQQLLLSRGDTPYRVVSFNNGGFYANSLKVYDRNFKLLKANIDYIATHKHVDASNYTGLLICSTVVILNHSLTQSVVIGGQLVGGDLAFSLTAEEDTITYLEGLAPGVAPVWGGMIGDYPQWQPGELQEERWERHHYGHLNASIERLGHAITAGNGVAEDQERARIKQRYLDFIGQFTSAINDHIFDMDRPHAITKAHVQLPLVQNYPVANTQVAEAGSSNAHYLTPRGILEMVAKFAYVPLDAHLSHMHTAHNPTAAQLNTYTTDQFNNLLDGKLGTQETAVGANGLMGYLAANPSVPVNFNQLQLYNEVRLNLNAANFTAGRVAPAHLGGGQPTATSILLGNGTWREFKSIFDQLTSGTGTSVYYAGSLGNNANGLAHISVTYANIQAYPVGTVVIFKTTNNDHHTSYTNGFSGYTAYDSNRAAIRGTSGWFVLS